MERKTKLIIYVGLIVIGIGYAFLSCQFRLVPAWGLVPIAISIGIYSGTLFPQKIEIT